MTVEQAAVFGAQAWEKAGSGKALTGAESKAVLRTIGQQISRNVEAERAPDRELVPA